MRSSKEVKCACNNRGIVEVLYFSHGHPPIWSSLEQGVVDQSLVAMCMTLLPLSQVLHCQPMWQGVSVCYTNTDIDFYQGYCSIFQCFCIFNYCVKGLSEPPESCWYLNELCCIFEASHLTLHYKKCLLRNWGSVQIRNYFNPLQLVQLCCMTLICPCLEYCCLVWG